jgi:phosphate starvation-inducible PhoH-like protein
MSTKPRNGKSRSKHIPGGHGLRLEPVEPLTNNQRTVFESNKNVVLSGCSGTGKTFISSYLALDDVINGDRYSSVIYIRSAVSTRDLGFLPGNEKDKVEVYERPYVDIVGDLFDRGDAYDIAKIKGLIKFIPTSFLRGTTLKDAVIIVDECQNMTYHELDSIITRIGDNCRIFICGDYFQSDLKENGLRNFHKVLKKMESFDFVEFGLDDIVRSDFVREYLIAKYNIFGEKQIS